MTYGVRQTFNFPSTYFLRADVLNSDITIAKGELNNLTNNLISEIKLNYEKLLLNIKLLDISKENLKINEEFLFVAGKKYEAGATSNLEVLGAKVNKIKIENEIKNIESQIKISKAELQKIMNVDYFIEPREAQAFEELHLSKEDLKKKAIQNNPELKISNLLIEKFSNQISLSKSEILPDISLEYTHKKIRDFESSWGFEVGVTVPLWFWWKQSGSMKRTNLDFTIARNENIVLKKSIETDLYKAFEEYENNLRQLKFFKDEVFKETDEILRAAKKSYEEGAIGYVEYLQDLNTINEAKVQYSNAVYNYNISIINLERLTGEYIK